MLVGVYAREVPGGAVAEEKEVHGLLLPVPARTPTTEISPSIFMATKDTNAACLDIGRISCEVTGGLTLMQHAWNKAIYIR